MYVEEVQLCHYGNVQKAVQCISMMHFTMQFIMGESSTIVSAYKIYRHLQKYCSHPSM